MDEISFVISVNSNTFTEDFVRMFMYKSVSTLICAVGVLSDCFTSKICMFCRNNS